MTRRGGYSPEIKERAVRMVFEHESEYGSQCEAIQTAAHGGFSLASVTRTKSCSQLCCLGE
jgi:transposase-like protein